VRRPLPLCIDGLALKRRSNRRLHLRHDHDRPRESGRLFAVQDEVHAAGSGRRVHGFERGHLPDLARVRGLPVLQAAR